MNKRSRNFAFLIGVVFLTLPLSDVSAQLYKWVDEQGNVTYSQSPPPAGIEGTTIKPPPPVNAESAQQRLESRLSSLEQRAEQRQRQAEQQQKSEQDRTEQARLCNQARARLASYQQPRVNVTDPDGTYRRLGEEERQRELEKSRQQVADLCN